MDKLKKYFVYENCLFTCPSSVQEAGEDTLFLIKNIDFSMCNTCLEIGVGMGLSAVLAAKQVNIFHGVDISGVAVNSTIKNGLINDLNFSTDNIFESDCFSKIKEYRYDIIFSNPPQLPTPEQLVRMDEIGLANNGGIFGRNIIDRIINEAHYFLNKNGYLYLLHFEMCDINKTIGILKKNGFNTELYVDKTVPFGKLSFERLEYIRSFYNNVSKDNNKYYHKIYIIKAKKL